MTALLLTPKSDAAWKVAGATMDEETGEMKVKEETTKVAAHLRRNGQLHRDKGVIEVAEKTVTRTDFFGLLGSWEPSQSTMMSGACF